MWEYDPVFSSYEDLREQIDAHVKLGWEVHTMCPASNGWAGYILLFRRRKQATAPLVVKHARDEYHGLVDMANKGY